MGKKYFKAIGIKTPAFRWNSCIATAAVTIDTDAKHTLKEKK
jgi:hypothetical protein